MTLITIISKSDTKSLELTNLERDVLFDELKLKVNIDSYHINNFKNHDKILSKKLISKSDIDIILLKNILKYTYPIISSYPNKDNKYKSNLILMNDYELQAMVLIKNKLVQYKIPSNIEFEVIGLIFPFYSKSFISNFNWLTNTDNSILFYNSDIFNVNDNIIRNNIELIKDNFNENIGNLIFDKLKSINISKEDYGYLFDLVDIHLLNKITDYILYYLNYYDKYLNNILQFHNKDLMKLKDYSYNYKMKVYNDNKNEISIYNKVIYNQINITNNYKIIIPFVYRQLNLNILYDYIQIHGFDHKIVKEYIYNIQQLYEIDKEKLINDNKIMKSNLIYINYERIARRKFPELFKEKREKFDINKISKKYKDIIYLEYDKQEKYLESYNNNDCPHIKLLKSFRNTILIDKKKYYYKLLKEFINKDDNNSKYYTCNNCKFNIICPHVCEQQENIFKLDKSDIDDTYNINQKIINKYMSDAPINFIYFCKICSEEIGKSFYLEQPIEYQNDIKMNMGTNEENEIKTLIISKTFNIVLKYLDFNILTINKKKLIYNIVDIIYPFINELERKLIKNKSSTDFNIQNELKFNIIIYIFGSIINLITLNQDIQFNTKQKSQIKIIKKEKEEKKVGGKKNVQLIRQLLKQSFDIIINSQNILINNLSLTSENIKQLLILSYTNIINKSNINIEINTKLYSIFNLIQLNPVYTYSLNINNIFPINNKKEIIKKDIRFEQILNKKEEDFDPSKMKKYQSIKIEKNNLSSVLPDIENKLDEIYNNIFDKIELPNYINNKLDNIEITSYELYIYLSYKNFRNYIVDNIFRFTPFQYQHKYKYNEHDLKFINNYLKQNEKLLLYDKILQYENNKYYLKPYKQLKSSIERLYSYNILNLNLYYCLDGNKQIFDTFIFKYKNSNKMFEYKQNEFNKLLDNKDYINDNIYIYDRYNSKCNEYLSEILKQSKDIVKKNENIIYNNITKNNKKISFYNYYIIKCPISNIHEYVNNVCKKCNIDDDIIKKKSNIYYTKYNKNFNEYFDNKKEIIFNELDMILKKQELFSKEKYFNDLKNKLNLKDENKFIKRNNYTIILSKKFKINEKYLLYLGLSENKEYNDIPKIDLEKEQINIQDRLSKVRNILNIIILNYNIFKYSETIIKFKNIKFNDLIYNFTKNGFKLKDLQQLKDLPYNYYDLIEYYTYKYSNEELIDIIINIIWNTIYFILEQSKGHIQKIVTDFVEFLIYRIMEFDETYSNYNVIKLKQQKFPTITEENNTNDVDFDFDLKNDDPDNFDEGDGIDHDIINYDTFDIDEEFQDLGDLDSFD